MLTCSGSYFLIADIRSVGFNGDDVEFCRMLTTDAGVTAVPVSAFYAGEAPHHFARFCFAKKDEALDQAIGRLTKHFKGGRAP